MRIRKTLSIFTLVGALLLVGSPEAIAGGGPENPTPKPPAECEVWMEPLKENIESYTSKVQLLLGVVESQRDRLAARRTKLYDKRDKIRKQRVTIRRLRAALRAERAD